MRIKNIVIGVVAVMSLAGCGGGDYSPKPQAYLRIDTPEPHYTVCHRAPMELDSTGTKADTLELPFSFEKNESASITLKKNTGREIWIDVAYPMWNGVVYLTYKRLVDSLDLRGQTDTSSHLLAQHYQFATAREEHIFESDDHTVHATVWELKGRNVASTYQFYATDSARHFLRGALFINKAPNNDSLAPILNYIQDDINHLVETLRWR